MLKRYPWLRNLPNWLTWMRIASVPGIICLMYLIDPETPEGHSADFNTELSFLAAVVFALASITDLIDGWLARKWDVITNLGKFLDPLADKLMVISVMIMLVQLRRAPAWIAIIIISRELAVTGLRSIASTDGVVIAASNLGKNKTTFQVIAILGLLVHYKYNYIMDVNYHLVGAFFLYVALFFTIWSGVDYFNNFWKAEKAAKAENRE